MQRLGRADRHPDLFDVDLDGVLAGELRNDRGPQRGDAAVGGVVRAVFSPGLGGGRQDVRRNRQIRLADRQHDHVVEFQRDLEDATDAGGGYRKRVRRERRHGSTVAALARA